MCKDFLPWAEKSLCLHRSPRIWWSLLQFLAEPSALQLDHYQTLPVTSFPVPVTNMWEKRPTKPFSSVQFSSVAQSCPTLCDPMSHSTPGLPVHHELPEFTHTHVHRVGDAIQPSHLLSSPSPPFPNLSQHQGLFQWVSSSHEMAKVLEFQL